MSGLLAIFNPDGLETPLAPLLARFPSRAGCREEWRDRHCAVARLHHGAISPSPQPVWNADRSLWLACDGELFATGDPALDGPAGRPTAATCLQLFERGQFEAFARLNGSFALLVYDCRARRLTLVTDRHEGRPLYYFTAGRELAAASFVAPLTAHPRCPRALDRQALHELLRFQRVIGPRTLYGGVRRVEPASLLSFDGAAMSSQRYWTLRWRRPDFTRRDAPSLLAETIKRAVIRRQEPGGRTGLLLSGGRDSRLLLAATAEPPTCFSLSAIENTEIQVARQAAMLRRAPFHFLQIAPERYWEHFDEAVRLTGGMQRAQGAHFLPALPYIRQHCAALLTGYGFDTIYRGFYLPAPILRLGGYSLRLPRLRQSRADDPAAAIAAALSYTRPAAALLRVLSVEARAEHVRRTRQAIEEALLGFVEDADSPHQNAWDYLQIHAIGRLDAFANVLSIRTWMDDRVVALDRDLFELYLQMPPAWRHPDRIHRAVFRKLATPALARLRHPDTTLRADLGVEAETALRLLKFTAQRLHFWPKPMPGHPFATDRGWPDFNLLLREHAPFRARLQALPDNQRLLGCGLFDRDGLRQVVDEHLDGGANYSRLLLILLALESWLRQFGADGID